MILLVERDGKRAEEDITGATFRVYTYLFLHSDRGVGPREVQRAVGFKSPSSAIYHLDKLLDWKYVQKHTNGEYSLVARQKIGILHDFVDIRTRLIPRYVFYALTLSIITFSLLLLFLRYGNLETILVTLPSVIAAIALWIESYRIWKRLPQF